GLRFGPGAATAFSMAPLMALFIVILARILRPEHASSRNEREGLIDRGFSWVGRQLGTLLDWIFLPLEWLSRGLGELSKSLFPPSQAIQTKRSRAQRERAKTGIRLVLLIPAFIFVLFPFFWIIITSFKTDLQIQRFDSIYWPNPWTLEQYQALIFKT